MQTIQQNYDMELFFVTINQDKVIYQMSDRMKISNHNVKNEIQSYKVKNYIMYLEIHFKFDMFML